MHQLRRTKLSLIVILTLLVTAVTGDDTASLTVKHGHDVTLPCGNVIKDQQKCDSPSWLFSRYSRSTAGELVTLGNISKNEKAKAKAKRLNVTEDCSLVIKNVTREDVGRYSCRQIRSGEQHGLDALLLLNVIDIDSDDPYRFYCSVFRFGDCAHTVKWYYKGDKTDISEHQQTDCTAAVIFTTEVEKSKIEELLFCNVTDKQSGQTLLCNAFSKSSCEKTGSTSAGGNEITEDETLKKPGWIRFIIVSVGLAVLIIIFVTISIWVRTKENKTQMDHNAVENDEGEASVIYENYGGHDASVRFQ
ncbi:uncharacterized protein [Labrus bergylta]|uniref:uncharacterized protein n=1 Tax=Labrus bergylta TaxID=56723 RepID=UPI0033137CC3